MATTQGLQQFNGIKQRKVREPSTPTEQETSAGGRISALMAPPSVPGHRFSYWLGIHTAQVADEHGYDLEDIASYTGVVKETVAKFWTGKTSPHEEEGIVAAVAALCGVDDPRDIYVDALRRWYNEGDPPAPLRKVRRPGGRRVRPAPDRLQPPEDPPRAEEA